jgi:hypothetical protein
MVDPDANDEDTWPIPRYNPGRSKHLHALGVIAVTFASFERSVDFLYVNLAREQHMPKELFSLYYFSLNEEKRIEAIRLVFKTFEKNTEVIALIENLLDYFQWCRNCRNQILHAEQYPPMFGGEPDTLYLTKRVGKRSPQTGYMKFKLSKLRFIADKVREGVVRCAEMHIYFRFRGRPLNAVPAELRAYVREPLPQILRIPRHLRLTPSP